MVVPREPISSSDSFLDYIRTGSRNSEVADSDVFMCGIYKHQQPVNGERCDRSRAGRYGQKNNHDNYFHISR